MTWVEGWQGGLVAGSALTLILDLAIRAWRYRYRYGHWLKAKCTRCNGDLDASGSGVGALENLCVCPSCGDTRIKTFAEPGDLLIVGIVDPEHKADPDVTGIRIAIATEPKLPPPQ